MNREAVLAAMCCSVVLAAQPREDPIVRLATEGWNAARMAAPRGGSAESLAPASRALVELDKAIEQSRWRLQGTYARSLVAAAMAAAQDERAEMEVHLTHARDLAARLETSAYPAEWPMPFDEAAGELWLEVDDYKEALKAFQRAVARNPDSKSWLGLARSAARVGDTARACDGYRQVARFDVSEQDQQEAREYIARCP